jgi:hypothetical protein
MPVFRLIPLRLHALSDALVIPGLLLTPWVWGFAGLNRPTLFIWAIAAVMLTAALLCAYPLGVVRLLPPKVHSLIEYIIAPSFFIMPFTQFADVPGATLALPVLGAVNLLSNALTDYPQDAKAAARRAGA